MKFKSYTFLIVFMTIMRTSAQFRKFFDNLGFNNLPLPFHTPQNSNNYQATSKPQEISRRFLQESPTDNNCGSCFSYRTGLFGYGASSGLIEIPHPDPVQSEVRAVLTVATQLSGDYGEISLLKSKEETASDIANGRALKLKVRFPVQNPLPKIHQLFLNGQLLCSNPKESAGYVTTLTLSFTFISNIPYNPDRPVNHHQSVGQQIDQPSYPQTPAYSPPLPTQQTTQFITTPWTTTTRWTSTTPWTTTTRQTRPPQTTTRKPVTTQTISKISTHDPFELDDKCGVTSIRKKATEAISLVISGKKALLGQFPWLVAYFYSKQRNEFICGGSLISRRLVITAAHCVQNKGDTEMRQAQDSTFFIGKNNLESLVKEGNYQTSVASELHIHPDWDTSNHQYLGDIAIAILAKTIEFNKFVKPICIWRKTTSSDDIDEKIGIVAGWGKTEFDTISTAEPLYVKIKAISGLKCALSDPRLSRIVSERSFCAGDRASRKGPCNGDSGGAFLMEENGKSYLRGVVSAALFDESTQSCDSSNYAVFSDVSKYTGWIDGFLTTYG